MVIFFSCHILKTVAPETLRAPCLAQLQSMESFAFEASAWFGDLNNYVT